MGKRELVFITERSGTENLYFQLFDEWPEADCTDALAIELLKRHIQRLPHGEAVCNYFGISNVLRDRNDAELVRRAIIGLGEVRITMSEEIKALFQAYSSDASRIRAYCDTLLTRLEKFGWLRQLDGMPQELIDFLGEATIRNLEVSTRTANEPLRIDSRRVIADYF